MDSELAVVIGAAIGVGGTLGGVYLTARQTARLAREARVADMRDRGLVAARLLQEELAWAEARMKQALRTGNYWSQRYELSQESWKTYRTDLALLLESPQDWAHVREGFRSTRTAELQASKRRKSDVGNVPATDWGKKRLGESLTRVQTAIEVLRPIAKDVSRVDLSEEIDRPEVESDDPEDANADPV